MQVEYEGFVHRVEAASLLIVFAPNFHDKNPDGTTFDLRFDVERLTFRLMHRAIEDVPLDVVWPNRAIEKDAMWVQQHEDYATSLDLPAEMNTQQRSVVASLLSKSLETPGTGGAERALQTSPPLAQRAHLCWPGAIFRLGRARKAWGRERRRPGVSLTCTRTHATPCLADAVFCSHRS